MITKFIGLVRTTKSGSVDASSLQIEDDNLVVIGILEHGAKFRPKNLTEANKLHKWLRAWLDKHYPAEDIAVTALIDIRDSTAYDVAAKARAAMALEKLGIESPNKRD